MILFISGRCDIPAFFSPWFFRRLEEGYVDVRNPFDPHQISRILLRQDQIDAMLFCTKNPAPMLKRLSEIPFPFLFHVTFTPYHQDIEPYVRDKESIIRSIKELSMLIGKKRVVLRYDPILLNERYTPLYHARAFEKVCRELGPYVERIILSFLDMYKNTRKHASSLGLHSLSDSEMKTVGRLLGEIAETYHIPLQTCAEAFDLEEFGITKGRCIDRKELEELAGHALAVGSRGVRKECGCLESVDIGDYNCCPHECRYCYANYDSARIQSRMLLHDVNSSVLLGHIGEKDRITLRRQKGVHQLKLL